MVVLQKSPQQISLIPRSSLIHQFPRILEGIEDVMKMDIHPRAQIRENLKKEIVHIAIDLRHMRGIDKQDVIRFQR